MPEFQLINEKRFPLKIKDMSDNVDMLDYYRWEHRVTVAWQMRRFMVFLDNLKQSVYIEEITDGNVLQLNDDSLWESIFKWVTEKGYLSVIPPLPKPPGYNKSKIQVVGEKIRV